MKKVLALVASATMLVAGGLFVSCSDETQDVYVTNAPEDYKYYGTFSWADETSFGSVSWSSGENSNGKKYHLECDDFYTTILKIGNTYFDINNDNEEVVFSSGTPESDTFTIKSIKAYSGTITNLKFTRAK